VVAATDARGAEISRIDAHPQAVLDCRIGGDAVRRLDVAAMFMSLWLLATMAIDVFTPKELTAYVIGTALAPAVIALAILYYKRVPVFDFAATFAMLWMGSWIVLEIITPAPLPLFVAAMAAAPVIVMGVIVNVRYWRLKRQTDTKPASSSS
jgi:hypothetical protein